MVSNASPDRGFVTVIITVIHYGIPICDFNPVLFQISAVHEVERVDDWAAYFEKEMKKGLRRARDTR